MSLPSWTKTQAFSTGTGGRPETLNVGQGCAVALAEGSKGIEKLTLVAAESTVTGTQNDYAYSSLASAPEIGISLLRWNGASDVTFNGFAGGVSGRMFLLKNITAAKTLLLATQTGGTAANRIICASVVGQYLGPGGSAWLWYEAGSVNRWHVEVIDPGAPITPAFNAGDYTNATVGSGDVTTCSLLQRGKMLTVTLQLETVTATGGTATIDRVIPGGFTATKAAGAYAQLNDNGTQRAGALTVTASGTTIRAALAAGGNWAASTNASGWFGVITFEVD